MEQLNPATKPQGCVTTETLTAAQQPRAGRKTEGRESWSQLPAFLLDQASQSACSSTGSLTDRPQTMEQGWEVAPGAKQGCHFPRAVSSNISLQLYPAQLPE